MSAFSTVPIAPNDPILHLNTLFKADESKQKINCGVGAYRDENGRPYVLPVVRRAEKEVIADPNRDHEYLPMSGLESFHDAAARLILGEDSPVIRDRRFVACQTLSGTGAVRLGAEFLAKFRKAPIYLSSPTWGNHFTILGAAGLECREYKYWNPSGRCLDADGFFAALESAPNGSIFVLHACAHNPTGIDPNPEQWMKAAEIMKRKGHFPFFDCAYQGFASGDLDKDAFAVRYFVSQGFELMVAQSFAKNLGLYSQRVGNLTFVLHDASIVENAKSQLCKIIRSMYSTPPAYGARITSLILNDPDFFAQWKRELKAMADRIHSMRVKLYSMLQELQTPGTWNHIIDQIGMFSFTGLSEAQSKAMVEDFHIYMTSNGRISVAGLNHGNIEYFAKSLDWVVRNVH